MINVILNDCADIHQLRYSISKVQVIAKSSRLERRVCVTGSFNKQRKKIPFCYFECFGVVKVARFGLVKPEVFKYRYVGANFL